MAIQVRADKGHPADIITRRVAAGTIYHRIFDDGHPDPLGFGLASSRFSDPRRIKRRFGLLYAGSTLEVAFLETIVRDRRNLNPEVLWVTMQELDRYAYVAIEVEQELDVVDLRGGNPIVMGIPTDAVRGRAHREGQRLSLSTYRHPVRPDGITYSSRLNEQENLAIYDRAVAKLRAGPRLKLRECKELDEIFDRYRIAIV